MNSRKEADRITAFKLIWKERIHIIHPDCVTQAYPLDLTLDTSAFESDLQKENSHQAKRIKVCFQWLDRV